MSHPIVTTLTTTAGQATRFAAAQSLGVAGPLVLTGAQPQVPRRVGITSAGNDSGITWTVTGTARPEQGGAVLVETIAGANIGLAQTTQDFASLVSIVGSGATASTVTAGTTDTASGPWVPWDQFPTPFQVTAQAFVLSGGPTYGMEFTLDDVFGLWLPSGITFPRASPWPGMTGATGNTNTQITSPVRATRLTLTVAGSVQLTQQQSGN